MIASFQIRSFNQIRRFTHAWRHGDLVARVVWIAAIALLSILAISFWQGRRLQARIVRLESSTTRLQADLAAKSSATSPVEWTDFVPALPDAPSAVQIMQTLQQAADKEGGNVVSLQAEDHPSTESTLGRLDLVISIKAAYPAILVVLQQTLDRYPGATVREFSLVHMSTPTGTATTAPAPQPGATTLPPVSASEAHVLLSFWRRPLGVDHRTTENAAAVLPAADPGAAPGSARAVPGGPTAVAAAPSTAPVVETTAAPLTSRNR